MKKLLLLLALAFLPVSAAAQNVRVSLPFPSVSSQYSPLLQANMAPNLPVLAVCHYPANQVPCTNYATTYNSAGTACANGAQDTPDPQPSSCQATGDAQGNLGIWIPPGTYDYTVCIENTVSCFGPYTISVTGGAGSILFQTNGVDNGSQGTVNLENGANITVSDDGSGGITIAAASAASTLLINSQTGASYTLALTDAGKCVEMNNASSNTLTVPPNSSVAFPVGTILTVRQQGAGQTTIAAGGGVTINTPETLLIRSQYGWVTLHKRATDEWNIEGNLQVAP